MRAYPNLGTCYVPKMAFYFNRTRGGVNHPPGSIEPRPQSYVGSILVAFNRLMHAVLPDAAQPRSGG